MPFYFTPWSPVLLNIATGRNRIQRGRAEEIVVLVSSIAHLRHEGVTVLFTDRHAYLRTARFFDDVSGLDQIDWDILRRKDFRRDPDDPEKFERYQAEALARNHVPVRALLGVACYDDKTRARIDEDIRTVGVNIRAVVRPDWYFQ